MHSTGCYCVSERLGNTAFSVAMSDITQCSVWPNILPRGHLNSRGVGIIDVGLHVKYYRVEHFDCRLFFCCIDTACDVEMGYPVRQKNN